MLGRFVSTILGFALAHTVEAYCRAANPGAHGQPDFFRCRSKTSWSSCCHFTCQNMREYETRCDSFCCWTQPHVRPMSARVGIKMGLLLGGICLGCCFLCGLAYKICSPTSQQPARNFIVRQQVEMSGGKPVYAQQPVNYMVNPGPNPQPAAQQYQQAVQQYQPAVQPVQPAIQPLQPAAQPFLPQQQMIQPTTPQLMTVQCPLNAAPGQSIEVQTPTGAVVMVQVPANVMPGQQFQIQI
eukprot:gnl/MRDRNA2_/MRDRNA2_120040_c0_seq1.p1 gnl/MRDRNA2_/MRDRNA2_120040_c0~~gnl/MRDRNA2_/MRDRNA2_120040_c0_seq1.p1  ORF type:complete len:240 (+),score=28.53 gnl/MRDRNA2_/MRDRNA2_120040_c0_seq1:117-836(+)